MQFDIITIFPRIFDSYLSESLIKRARQKKLIDIKVHNMRDFTPRPVRQAQGKQAYRKQVDDRPFGGGPGMVLKIEPIYRAVGSILSKLKVKSSKLKVRTILFSTRGRKLDAKTAKRLAKYDRLILICGRYEGVDERVAKYVADEEISIGDYVLSGGELPALVLIETVSRFLPGFLGKKESLEEIKGSYPVYTRPEIFMPTGKSVSMSSSLIRANKKVRKYAKSLPSNKKQTRWTVPKVLLSGNHKKIDGWRKNISRRKYCAIPWYSAPRSKSSSE